MERLPGDVSGGNSAIVPATGSMMPANAGAPVPNAAEVNPTPMTVDEGFFYQPVQAYFQFVQNNLTYMNEGNIDAFRREAEERHAQVMEQKVQQLYQEFEQVCLGELAEQRAEAKNRHEQMTSEFTGFAMSHSSRTRGHETEEGRNLAMQMQSLRTLQMQLRWKPSKEQTKRSHT